MKIGITGIAGFIGMHAALALKARGHDIVGLDDFNDYYSTELKYDRSKLLREHGITQIGMFNIESMWPTDYRMFLGQCDVILHLAAYANPRHAIEHPHLYIDVNITGTQNLIACAEAYKTPKIVYASSSCVMYGNPTPWTEGMPFHRFDSPYGYSKFVNECQFHMSKIPSTVGLRFFTVYGPWGRPDMALWSFADKIVKGEEIELYNYGNMKRDFTYVDDIIQGIILTIEGDMENQHEIFNIGYGKPVELMDFVKAIEKNLGREAKIKLAPPYPGEVIDTWSDTTKLQKLGYKPTTSVEEGVEKFISWYKHYHNVN